ncbi:hypothetical protein [Cellulomonas sp. RIT-PI-Y]|uniref:hypothetical protein n=1 Tax=Cellulomonas sp. RIT-PI-Y TaxID=3035297 RepID=UPI0021D9AC36|nr:hypothetical protein [Cellulomonas sp. RIT-PI-Y]
MGIFKKRRAEDGNGSHVEPVPVRDDVTPGGDAPSPRGPAWNGRGLSLPHPPRAEHAAALADSFVEAAQNIGGIALDYSTGSLRWVDDLLDSFGEPGSDLVAETTYTAGCYVGEVLVRGHGYRWVDLTPEQAQLFGFLLVVTGPGGNTANPIGKAFKLVENGLEDSVAFFVDAELAANRRG